MSISDTAEDDAIQEAKEIVLPDIERYLRDHGGDPSDAKEILDSYFFDYRRRRRYQVRADVGMLRFTAYSPDVIADDLRRRLGNIVEWFMDCYR